MIVYNGVLQTFFQDDGFQLLNNTFANSFGIQVTSYAKLKK